MNVREEVLQGRYFVEIFETKNLFGKQRWEWKLYKKNGRTHTCVGRARSKTLEQARQDAKDQARWEDSRKRNRRPVETFYFPPNMQ